MVPCAYHAELIWRYGQGRRDDMVEGKSPAGCGRCIPCLGVLGPGLGSDFIGLHIDWAINMSEAASQ